MFVRFNNISRSLFHVIICSTVLLPVNICAQGTWESTLRGRDLDGDIATFEAWYDTVLNTTWLANAGLSKVSQYATGGYVKWDDAILWVDDLNNTTYFGYNNWRLPDVSPVNGVAFGYDTTYDGTTDRTYNLSAPGTPNAGSMASEMAHLYFNTLGNIAALDFQGNPTGGGAGVSNAGPFTNIEETGYWNSLEYELDPVFGAWQFSFEKGFQDPDPKFATIYNAWAVHTGDIGSPPKGDVNMDGEVGIVDYMLVQNYLLGLTSLSAIEKAHADVYPAATGDALVTISDLVLIMKNIFE